MIRRLLQVFGLRGRNTEQRGQVRGRIKLGPGEKPPRVCPCGSNRIMLAEENRIMLAEDMVIDDTGKSHTRDLVFCENCRREWELSDW